jgi:triphosphoribosyl-dephospho-CoA synthase
MQLGLYAQIACIWEATAHKPGNVHRFRDFEDASYVDFLVSAAALAPVLQMAPGQRVGATVLEAIRATRTTVSTNTNLGIVLLLAPLAAVPGHRDLRASLEEILKRLDVDDARMVYEAIRLAAPGGLGRAPQQDLSQEPTVSLQEAMLLAADRDLVACQYANGFREVLDEGVPSLRRTLAESKPMEEAIIVCHLELMANHPDSLIARKRGIAEAEESAMRARSVIDAGWPDTQAGRNALSKLDSWLRAEGHARNPGATADLVAASLFAALRQGIIKLPAAWQPLLLS